MMPMYCQQKTRIIIALSVIIAAALLLPDRAYAQRTSRGQLHIDFAASSSLMSDPSLGGSVAFGQYLLSSRWDAGIDFLVKRDGTPYYPIYAQASYMQRFCANRSRAVHLYGGLGVLMGAEITAPSSLTPSTGFTEDESGVGVDFSEVATADSAVATVAFLYGVQARLEVELFLATKVALIGSLRMPLTFGSEHTAFNLVGGVGLRFNL